jgi:hypothetical protein
MASSCSTHFGDDKYILNVCRKTGGKTPSGIPERIYKINIKMYRKQTDY